MTTDLVSPKATHEEARTRTLLEHVLEEGSLRDLLPLQAFDDESLYALGYELYAKARYEPAAALFALLVARDCFERRYLQAYAACLQMMGRHATALSHHLTAALMDPEDPTTIFHACECLIAMGHLNLAGEALTKLQTLYPPGKNDPLLRRAQGLLDLIQQHSFKRTEGSSYGPYH